MIHVWRSSALIVISLSTLVAVAGCASSGVAGATSSTLSPPTATADARRPDALGVMDSRVGTGAKAALHQCLYVHYVGVLADGRPFDSTRAPLPNGKVQPPVAFELGSKSVMPGWEQGLVGMQVGGLRRLWVPYRLAYGAGGQPPAIPPRTDLVFDIELMAVTSPLPNSSGATRAESAKSCPSWNTVSRR